MYLNESVRTFAFMKSIATMLSFLILFLAIEPGVNAMVHPNQAKEKTQCCCCCKHHCKAPAKEKRTNPNSCCDYGNGNPFMLCNCCVGFVLASANFQISPISFLPKNSVNTSENIHSVFFADFWQPPKIS